MNPDETAPARGRHLARNNGGSDLRPDAGASSAPERTDEGRSAVVGSPLTPTPHDAREGDTADTMAQRGQDRHADVADNRPQGTQEDSASVAATPMRTSDSTGTRDDARPVNAVARTDDERHATNGQDDATATPKRKGPPLLAFVLGLSAVVSLMLLAFATPAVKSGAKDLPLAVSGPQQAVTQVESQLAKQAPGAFDVKTYASASEGADAIKNRDAVGGIALDKGGVTIQTASGAGAPYTNVLKGIGSGLEKQGQKVTYTDLVPLPKKDPSGAAMTSSGLPLIFGGMATSAAVFFGLRGSTGRRALVILGVSALAGMAAAAIVHTWLEATTGSYWPLAGAFSLGIAAIAFTVIGLAKNLGPIGFGLGALTMLFISNPISGLASGADWLPKPWGAIGQFLPVGAAGTALRSAAYFDGRGATHAWIVLACWAIGGALLMALGRARKTAH